MGQKRITDLFGGAIGHVHLGFTIKASSIAIIVPADGRVLAALVRPADGKAKGAE